MSLDPASKAPAVGSEHQRQNQLTLLTTRRFAPLFLTQLLGAFNDQLFKTALVVSLALQVAERAAPEGLIPLAAAIYILPVALFSASAGQLADKYDKATLARLVKAWEVLLMCTATLGVWWQRPSLVFAALGLLGLQAALFGPVKYAILPQLLRADELVGGNALVATGTFGAILTGSLAGALLAGFGAHETALTGLIVAAVGFLASLAIPAAPAAAPELHVRLNPVCEIWRNIKRARQERTVFASILGIALCWLYGALLLAQFTPYARSVLGADHSSATLLLAVVTFGIGAGALLCQTFSGKPLEVGLVPVGAMGLALFALELFCALPGVAAPAAPLALAARLGEPWFWRIAFDLCALGVFGGFFIVPLTVLIQQRSAAQQRGRIVSVSTLLNALAAVAGALIAAGLPDDGAAFPWLFALAAPGLVAVAGHAYSQERHLSLRLLTGILIHSFYRLGKTGFAHIPESGPAVLVCNHVSFVDSVVIMAAVRRPIRFVIDHRIHRTPFVGFIFRHSRTIPIATAKDNLALKEAAFNEVALALRNGELIGLFPEGAITRTGEINHFRYGVGRIVAETPVPVIPMALRGLWGSFFSRRYGPAMSKPSLLRPFARIELVVGPAVAAENVTPESLQELVTELRGGLV